MKKGIIAGIFKGPHGSSDGIANFSSRFDRVVVISSKDFEVDEVFDERPDLPAVTVVRRTIFAGHGYLTAYPCKEDGSPDTEGRSFGGCYIHSSDSRITAIGEYPIPLHDRKE